MLHSLGQTKKASETALTEKLFCKSFQNCLAGIMTSHNIDSGQRMHAKCLLTLMVVRSFSLKRETKLFYFHSSRCAFLKWAIF